MDKTKQQPVDSETYLSGSQHSILLLENIQAEKNWYEGIKFLFEEIRNEGLDISISEKEHTALHDFAATLFKIRYFRKLIHACGLNTYEEHIMKHLIDKHLGVTPTPPIEIKNPHK